MGTMVGIQVPETNGPGKLKLSGPLPRTYSIGLLSRLSPLGLQAFGREKEKIWRRDAMTAPV